MTLVPSSTLRQRITTRAHQGTRGIGGPSFGPDRRNVPARFEGRRRQVRTASGQEVTSTATVVVRPGDQVDPEGQIDHDGTTYTVAELVTIQGLTGPAGYQMVLVP